jgi:hypothetical protein
MNVVLPFQLVLGWDSCKPYLSHLKSADRGPSADALPY